MLSAPLCPRSATQMLQFLEEYGFVDKTADLSGMPLESLKGREAALKRRLDVLDQVHRKFQERNGTDA